MSKHDIDISNVAFWTQSTDADASLLLLAQDLCTAL